MPFVENKLTKKQDCILTLRLIFLEYRLINTCTYTQIYIYMCIHLYTYICTYIYLHIYIHSGVQISDLHFTSQIQPNCESIRYWFAQNFFKVRINFFHKFIYLDKLKKY